MTDIRIRRRQAILQAAVDEFCRCGFERARMDAIAASAGIGKSTIYEYFPSKTALLEAVGETMYARVAREISDIMTADVSFRTKAVNYLRLFQSILAKLGDKMLSVHHEDSSFQVFNELARRYTTEVLETLVAAVRAGQSVGELREDADPRVVAGMLLALPHPGLTMTQSARPEELIDVLLRGIAP